MSRPEDNVQYSSDVLDAADPRAQAFAEHDAARNSIDEVLDNWAQQVSPRILPSELGKPLPGDGNAAATPPSDRSAENILGCPTIIKDGNVYLQGYASAQSDSLIKDNKVYLQGHVSVESDASENTGSTLRGVQSVGDIEQVGVGVAKGLTHAGGEYLEFLSKPNAVNNAIEHNAESIALAVNYYSARPDEIIPDAQRAGEQIGQALIDKLGHPLTPEQTGELAGEMMTVFIPIGRARALTDGEIEALGGTQKLEAMSADELKELGLKRPKMEPWPGENTEESVVIKLRSYLLDLNHKEGGPKARFLKEVLGYTNENMEGLASQLKFDPVKAVFHQNTPHGPILTQTIRTVGANGETREIPFVWIHNTDDVIRLVTIKKIPNRPR